MKIRIYYDNINYRFSGWRKASGIVMKIIEEEGLTVGEISFIITKDSVIRPMNLEFLNHDYNTDVIAFDYRTGNTVNGEIYISMETVKRNSDNYNVSLRDEMLRVLIHGVLHLTGYKDKTDDEKIMMRMLEEKWMKRFLDQGYGIQI